MGTAIAYLELDTSKFSKGFVSAYNDLKVFGDKSAKAEQKLKGLSSAFKTTGGLLSKNVTLPIVGVGAAALKSGTDFESAMSQVAATMGTTTDKIQDLSKFAQHMGATTVFSATQAAEGLNVLAQSGLTAEEQMKALPEVLNLAAAGNLSLADSSTYVVGTLKGFGKGMDEAKRVTDLVAKGATMANTDVRGLGTALSSSSATAKSYGQNMDSVTLSLLRLAEQNITGEEAATALNRAMMDLYTPTSTAKKALDELGISVYDAQGNARDFNDVVDELNGKLSGMSEEEQNAYKNTIFTTYGLQAFNKMTVSSTEKVNDFKEGLKDANDSALKQAQTQLDNLKGDITLFKSALESAGIVISNVLIPNIRNFIQWLTNLVTKFNKLSEEQQDLIVKIGLIVAAIGPAMLILSKVISVVLTIVKVFGLLGKALFVVKQGFMIFQAGNMIAAQLAGVSKTVLLVAKGFAFMLNPITLVIAAIGALVGVFVYLYKTNEDFRNKVIEVWETIKEAIGNAIENISLFFTETLPETFNSAVEAIASFVNGVIEFFTVTIPEAFNTFVNETIPNAINSIVQWFEQLPYMIGYAIGELIGYFYLFATDLRTWITTELPLIIEGIIRWFAQLPSRIWGWLTRVVTNVIKWGVDMYNNAVLAASNFVNGVIEWILQLPSRVWSWLIKTVSNVISWGANMVSQARSTATNFVNSFISFIASLPSKVWGIIKQIPSKVSAIGSQLYNAGRSIFQSLWNGIKSIGESILGWVSDFAGKIRSFVSGIIDGFQNIVSGANDAKSAARSVDGKHANGLDYVPYNGYVAELHEGERVLTKQQNKEYNEGRAEKGGDTFNFYNTKPTPYEYARQMKKAKKEMLYGI